jgi:hypothetical protein
LKARFFECFFEQISQKRREGRGLHALFTSVLHNTDASQQETCLAQAGKV